LWPRGQNGRIGLVLNYLSFAIMGSLITPWALRGRPYDVVLVYAPSPLTQAYVGLVLKWVKKAPMLLWVQDLWPESLTEAGGLRNPLLLALVKWAVRRIYVRTDRLLIQSRAFHAPIKALVPDHPEIHYVPNSLPEDPAAAVPTPRAEALAEQIATEFSVVFAGNLGQAQGLEEVLEAAALVQDLSGVTIYLIGSGRMEERLRARIAQLGLNNVVLPGRFPASDMPLLLSAASALLVTLRPAPIFSYTIPNKLQAYLAAGRPVIAALDGEGARILDEAGAGLSCPAGDPEALAAAIRKLGSASQFEIERMSIAGRVYFETHFSLPGLTSNLISHFEQAAAAKRGAE
ncbi:MAG: glycosyltransferase family 4 protein, partial [Roseovarius sp.]